MDRPRGDIVTLLDLTPRDYQDNELFPLAAEKTWWLPDDQRRNRPFTTTIQRFPFRGPTGYGQRFTFDLKSVNCGDLLFGTVLRINLRHWFDDTTILRLQTGQYAYQNTADAWYFANSLGTIILQEATLEVNDQVIERVDGDFLNVFSLLFQDLNRQYGPAVDGLGRYPFSSLLTTPSNRPYPTTSGELLIPLPFFYQRIKFAEAFPLLAAKEGSMRINITLRPFQECVRKLTGTRASCDETPLAQGFTLHNDVGPITLDVGVQTGQAPPSFNAIELITYGAHTDGKIRQQILRSPFEILHRKVATFFFDEPLKYATNKTAGNIIQVQLPLEVNHPIEEIIWFVRRKGVANNNEWTNYSSVLCVEHNPVYAPRQPLLQNAAIQLNGIEIVNTDENWFRQHISNAHKGGSAAYDNFIYGYSFSDKPGQHQPSGSVNASKLQSVRLTLDVQQPANQDLFEVKVFVLAMSWLRFQNGIVNKMFAD